MDVAALPLPGHQDVGLFVFLTPMFALLFGALWLNEAVTLPLVGALTLVAAGIVLVNRRATTAGPHNANAMLSVAKKADKNKRCSV